MTNTYLISKKIHRLLVLIILTIGLLMAVTGLMLKYPSFAMEYLPFLNLGKIRYLHNSLSLYFSIVLVLMIMTGIWMYIYPSIKKFRSKSSTPPDDQTNG